MLAPTRTARPPGPGRARPLTSRWLPRPSPRARPSPSQNNSRSWTAPASDLRGRGASRRGPSPKFPGVPAEFPATSHRSPSPRLGAGAGSRGRSQGRRRRRGSGPDTRVGRKHRRPGTRAAGTTGSPGHGRPPGTGRTGRPETRAAGHTGGRGHGQADARAARHMGARGHGRPGADTGRPETRAAPHTGGWGHRQSDVLIGRGYGRPCARLPGPRPVDGARPTARGPRGGAPYADALMPSRNGSTAARQAAGWS
ncbi:hypothetical protein SAVIM338S_03324 [Streptomyces avidinii]